MSGRPLLRSHAATVESAVLTAPTPDRDRAMSAVRELLIALGENPDRPGLARTPQRVTDLLADLFSGVGTDPSAALGAPIPLEDSAETGELVGVTGIPFRSLCEHHLLPFDGTVDVYFLPRERLAGFSRVVRLVETASRRPQLQERLGQQIARAVMSVLEPSGVVVRIEATHGCIAHLEPHARTTKIVTLARAGVLPEASLALAWGHTPRD